MGKSIATCPKCLCHLGRFLIASPARSRARSSNPARRGGSYGCWVVYNNRRKLIWPVGQLHLARPRSTVRSAAGPAGRWRNFCWLYERINKQGASGPHVSPGSSFSRLRVFRDVYAALLSFRSRRLRRRGDGREFYFRGRRTDLSRLSCGLCS